MIQFSKVRLHGFKSFVEKTDLDIGPGLTGIVGPNGCGKSNLVEALRWNMGENSSKRMRGGTGTMDDVIFSGTEKRPARNVAEVTVLLDNTSRKAPAAYNDTDQIEIIRRIERDHGSAYRINGKPVRARDVQMLYADLTSGAGSPFLVSQGKVTNLIQAKPLERRVILEEAAGITGLYARRHEAELRLRATDANLKRVEDLLGGMDTRLQALKKQGRQATKYRNLSAQIRQFEIMIASLEWRRTQEKLFEVQSQLGEIESLVAERQSTVSQLMITQNTQAADIPGLRQQDAEMAAALQTQKLALQRLEDEAQRLSEQLTEAKEQLARIRDDRQHEDHSLNESSAIIERIESEEKTLLARQDSQEEELARREALRQEKQAAVADQESAYNALVEKNADARARRQALERQLSQDRDRQESLTRRVADVEKQLAELTSSLGGVADIDSLRQGVTEQESSVEKLRLSLDDLEKSLAAARQERETAADSVREKESVRNKLESEISALEAIIKSYTDEGFRPVFEDVRADSGFELALSRALGDTLMASLDDNAPVVWARPGFNQGDLPALPPGARALSGFVAAPDILKPALSQIGVVDNDAQGFALTADLKPGQSLVSRDGAYWRWDGLQIRVTAADRHAVQLRQKNRLAELQEQIPAAIAAADAARAAAEKAAQHYSDIQSSLNETRSSFQSADNELRNRRTALNRTIEEQAGQQARRAKMEESIALAQADLASLQKTIADTDILLANFSDDILSAQQADIAAARSVLDGYREELQAAISNVEISRQEQSRRQARLRAIADERVNLQNRAIRARERLKDLAAREESLTARIDDLKQRPSAIKSQSAELLSLISGREAERTIVSDRLAACESELADTMKALKDAEALLSEARESRAHAQATMAERERQIEEIRTYIGEQFAMAPEELAAQAALSDDALPDLDTLKQQKDKAVRDRDMIGPVNLRADIEAEDLEKELSVLLKDKDDLAQAVEELRQGIQTLNTEARERLQQAFEQVNTHFGEMFVRLFQGGRAHLSLIEADDPLEAGLEIFAQPPGKALQSLSLLSGGEQTLTAVALIFAIFMTNPAPICVLDEVDAPLDDANVDRFCDLLREFASKGETRFLLITHHRLTMARMDRLYGVTMSERGVSQLVSVDLNQQLDFLEAA